MRKYPTSAKLVVGCPLGAGNLRRTFLMRGYPSGAKLVMGWGASPCFPYPGDYMKYV